MPFHERDVHRIRRAHVCERVHDSSIHRDFTGCLRRRKSGSVAVRCRCVKRKDESVARWLRGMEASLMHGIACAEHGSRSAGIPQK